MTEEKKIKLLIADDDEKFLQTIAERLGLKDFDVTTASDGEQAIKAAKKKKFDIAILDLKMPDRKSTRLNSSHYS